MNVIRNQKARLTKRYKALIQEAVTHSLAEYLVTHNLNPVDDLEWEPIIENFEQEAIDNVAETGLLGDYITAYRELLEPGQDTDFILDKVAGFIDELFVDE